MTQAEKDMQEYELAVNIMNAFKDIQTNANTLKTHEDRAKITTTFTKIKDYMDDVMRWFDDLDRLSMVAVDEEDEGSKDSYSYF